MVRQVRGTGTLVPEAIRWIPATTEGTVERIVIRPGAAVEPRSVILELSNPELDQRALEAQLELTAAEARLINRQADLDSQLLAPTLVARHRPSRADAGDPASRSR